MQSRGRLESKTSLITGAARGTGAVIARHFVEEGARVVIADILDEPGEALARELGERAVYAHLDVTCEADWQREVRGTEERFGALDVLVNNAGVLHMAALEETRLDDYERVVRVNQVGTFLGLKTVSAPMRRAGSGAIVNISSIDGLQGKNGLVAYAASKWAIRGMTRVAALELGKHGIRVNTVCPEAGSAEMMAPYLPPGIDVEELAARGQRYLASQRERSILDRQQDIARLVGFLASDESASCTGADFPIEGGNTAGRIIRGAPGA